MLGDVKDFLFFDVEVFSHNSLVVFKNVEGKTIRVFSSSLDGFGDLLKQGIVTEIGFTGLKEYIKDRTLVGYNNYFYDDFILYAMSMNFDQDVIKAMNDSIIQNTSRVNMKRIDICKTLDVFQQIDISKPGLKKIEGNMGKSIVESSIDFNIDRPLTPDENFETFKYCEYDVAQTLEIFKMRSGYFESKMQIVEMLPEDIREKAYRWNTTSIIGQLLNHKHDVKTGRLVSDEMLDMVPVEVRDMWHELDNPIDYRFKKRKVIVREGNCLIEFGWGGLHGAPDGRFEAKDVKLFDVASMYPNILINFEGLSDKTGEYKRILEHRLQLKHEGKKKEQAPYKLILNSTYGLLNNQYNALNHPSLAYSICIYGQISLYDLTKRLQAVGCTVFNINTDGVAFVPDKSGRYKDVVHDWEERFSLTLEENSFKRWVQKDVNNYVALTDEDRIYVKGGDVNNYHDVEDGGRNYYFNNANTRIVHKAVVDMIIKGKSVADTIWEHRNRPELYQYVLQAGSTYLGTVDSTGKLLQKVNRVFAGKNTNYEIFKKRHDGGSVKFPDAPTNMVLWNGDLSEFKDFEKVVDFNWYNALAEKVCERWEKKGDKQIGLFGILT